MVNEGNEMCKVHFPDHLEVAFFLESKCLRDYVLTSDCDGVTFGRPYDRDLFSLRDLDLDLLRVLLRDRDLLLLWLRLLDRLRDRLRVRDLVRLRLGGLINLGDDSVIPPRLLDTWLTEVKFLKDEVSFIIRVVTGSICTAWLTSEL
ncbi:hypothetical protein MAR_000059 [Mya arenaria]|uniref:Uncharacterized protein n=1 Tax=Mya arenaria TaxID=6604 RepID=A0ABY7FG59_MYAAR|nr:hypothetical protein MAR_000059 [Mya arenaria]